MAGLPLDTANAVIAGALTKARELNLKPMGIAVFDPGGHVLSFQREDSGAAPRLQIAAGKAAGALALGISSRMVAAIGKDNPFILTKLDSMMSGGVIPAPGALVIEDAQGNILGAVAATGDTGDNDEICARAGIEAVGLTARG